ncbi:MAG: hypothetical protein O9284_07095 [Steroidobacteraceae bacterium]|nr:hypothetical protein [Steroidobacteraceae bacterium]
MRPWIKICGLTTPAAVAAAVEARVEAVGFVFHAASPRNLAPRAAAALAREVPREVLRVAVTRHPTQALIDEIAAELRPDMLQTDLEDYARLRLPHGLARLPVLRACRPRADALPELFLYEGPNSGTGELADWAEARRLARAASLVLAGGLGPDNVAAAVSAVRPFGVDVSSGVESAPGTKDPARISDFVAAARGA